MDSEGSQEQNLCIWVYCSFFLCVWAMVDFFHTSHSWLDDKVPLLTHSRCMARVGAMIIKG